MKKINLILGACVIAAAVLLASCQNGPQDMTNVRTHNYRYAYTVTGSLSVTDNYGVTTAYNVETKTASIKKALADISWSEDALAKKNFDSYKIELSGTADWKLTETLAGGTPTTTKFSGKFGMPSYSQLSFTIPLSGYYDYTLLSSAVSLSDVYLAYAGDKYPTNSSGFYSYYSKGNSVLCGYGTVFNDITIELYEMGGDYYIWFDSEYLKLPEDAFDGFLGDDEFTLKYSTTVSNRTYLTQAQKDDTTAVNTTTTSYNLSFKKVSAE